MGSEIYPSYSSSDDEDESIFSCLVSGNLQTICAKSMNVYLKNEMKLVNCHTVIGQSDPLTHSMNVNAFLVILY